MINSLFSFTFVIFCIFCHVNVLSGTGVKWPCPKPGPESIIYGYRIESDNVFAFQKDVAVVKPDIKTKIKFFGCEVNNIQRVRLVPRRINKSHFNCSLKNDSITLKPTATDETLSIEVTFSEVDITYEFCVSFDVEPTRPLNWTHLASVDHLSIRVENEKREYYMPLALQITLVGILLFLSGLFSGLNLGLMALDLTELKIIHKSGTDRERQYAERIIPVRRTGNYLLCTLLLGNVIVNSAISILFDDLTSGPVALVVSSLGIVILGEIVPQSVCSRYGLAVGARTIWLTRFFMVLTFPLSYPISKVLDWILGEEVGQVYDKGRLLELIRLTGENNLEPQGALSVMKIAQGALELAQKTVGDVMTLIQDVYMINIDSVLDTKTLSEIVQSGFTRIPVCSSDDQNEIVGILNVKDLVLLDPDDKTPLRTICHFYNHQIRYVLPDTPLSTMLDEFRSGHYHLALVRKIVDTGQGDPFYELAGLVTLEDVIEEIIQAEILDETDRITDNRRRLRRKETQMKDFSIFTTSEEVTKISPQLTVAAYQYLTTQLEAFKSNYISVPVVQRLIKQNSVCEKQLGEHQKRKYLYQKGKSADYFVLILEGRVEVTTGTDDFVFEAGPFFIFGKQVVEQMQKLAPKLSVSTAPTSEEACRQAAAFVPDFTARITQDVTYFRLKAVAYLKAYRATLIERGDKNSSQGLSSVIKHHNLLLRPRSAGSADIIKRRLSGTELANNIFHKRSDRNRRTSASDSARANRADGTKSLCRGEPGSAGGLQDTNSLPQLDTPTAFTDSANVSLCGRLPDDEDDQVSDGSNAHCAADASEEEMLLQQLPVFYVDRKSSPNANGRLLLSSTNSDVNNFNVAVVKPKIEEDGSKPTTPLL